MRGFASRRIAACVFALILGAAQAAVAQTTTAPGSHWGASMYPRLRPGFTVGFELLGFTEFGKGTDSQGAPLTPQECKDSPLQGQPGCGIPDRYNHMRRTIGLNLLSATLTRPLKRYDVKGSNLLYTHTFVLGKVGDKLTELYQNQVIHAAADLQEIPRGKVACSHGKELRKVYNCFAVGYGGELNYQVNSFDRGERFGVRETPFFAGAGFFASNLESDVYTQIGMRRFDLTGAFSPSVARIAFLSFSAMSRAGVLVPGAILENLANLYFAADATLGLHLAPYDWPVVIEFGYAASTGQFVDRPREMRGGREVQSGPAPAALPERMYHLRVELGELTFETYNDAPGGKDKGPSFGARLFYTFVPGTTEGLWFTRLFRRKEGR